MKKTGVVLGVQKVRGDENELKFLSYGWSRWSGTDSSSPIISNQMGQARIIKCQR
jgi:hypothetical protein